MATTTRALAFVSRWFDEATVRRVFEPLIADWQREWLDASPTQRGWVSLRGSWAFLCAALVSSPEIARTPVPTSVANRVARRIAIVVGLISMLLLVPVLTSTRFPGGQSVLILLLLPAMITLAFPFAMTAAVDAIRRYDRLTPQIERAAVFKLYGFSLLFMLIFSGWVVPASSYAWRAATNPDGAAPLRRVEELSTTQLVLDPARATVYAPATSLASRSAIIRRTLNQRATMTALPIVLMWMRWRSLNQRRDRWYSPLPTSAATVVTIVAFAALWSVGANIEIRGLLPASIGVWLPAAAFALWAGVAASLRRQIIERA
jgi:hypothetical protein